MADGTPRCGKCGETIPWVVNAGEADFDAEINTSAIVLVDFWAPWCGPCRMAAPILQDVAGRFAGRIKLVKVNVDEHPAVAARYNAMSIPLLVLIRNGQEVDGRTGAASAPQLTRWVETILGPAHWERSS